MTLYKKSFLYSAFFILVFLSLFFILYGQHLKKEVTTQAQTTLQEDIRQFENAVDLENSVPETAEAIFVRDIYKAVMIKDFVETVIYEDLHPTGAKPNPVLASIFPIKPATVTEYAKDREGENISLIITLDAQQLQVILQNALQTVMLYLAATYVVMVLSLMVLFGGLLRPLKDIRKQIFHMQENKFIETHKFPKTSDLRELIVMLNNTTTNLKSKFKKDSEILNKYYEVIYNDEETGLSNRNYFMMNLNSELDSANEKNRGLVIFVRIVNFESLNNSHGYEKVTAAMQKLVTSLERLEIPYAVLARIKPDTFAYLISDQKYEKSQNIINKHYDDLLSAFQSEFEDIAVSIAVAAGEFKRGDSIKALLSKVDTALSDAVIITHRKRISYAKTGQRALSKSERLELIAYAFKNNSFDIELRPIQDLHEDRKNFLTVLSFLKDKDENSYNKSEFLSILYEKDMVAQYDKIMIEKVASRYRLINHPITVMLPISSDFINSLEHMRWFGDKLEELQSNHYIKLCFCVKDNIAQNELDKLLSFSKMVYRFKYYIAISEFTLDQEKLSYLQRLKPRYIVIDQDYIEDLYTKDKTKVKAINFMIHEVNAKVVVGYMDDPSLITKMQELDVDYLLRNNYKGEY
ncbi:MAG: EAL domain-containing protein [Campylobacterota bacterium]